MCSSYSHAELPRPKALIYDWDNTLVDTWPVIHAAMNVLFRHMKMPEWHFEETKARVRHSMRDAFPALFGSRWEEARDIFYDAFESVHIAELTMLPGADALLQQAADLGLVQGIVSNKQGKYLRLEVAHLGWEAHFANIVGAGDAARDKPAPDPIDLALKGTGLAAGPEIYFVGDSGVDMQIAHATGLTPILIHAAENPGEEFDTYPPLRHFRSLTEFQNFLTALPK